VQCVLRVEVGSRCRSRFAAGIVGPRPLCMCGNASFKTRLVVVAENATPADRKERKTSLFGLTESGSSRMDHGPRGEVAVGEADEAKISTALPHLDSAEEPNWNSSQSALRKGVGQRHLGATTEVTNGVRCWAKELALKNF